MHFAFLNRRAVSGPDAWVSSIGQRSIFAPTFSLVASPWLLEAHLDKPNSQPELFGKDSAHSDIWETNLRRIDRID